MEAGLQRKGVLVLAAVVLMVSLAVAQSTSSDFPPDELLQHITADGLRAHMAFLSDDLLEGRGIGTRGYQLGAAYVRAQFEEMGLKPAGVTGSYFQNVRYAKDDKGTITCGVWLRRLRGHRCARKNRGCHLRRPSQTALCPWRSLFFFRTEIAHGRGAWSDWISRHLGGQDRTAYSVF